MKIKQAVKKGFTLVELLVVIAIIAILAAVVAPNAFKAIEKSKVSAAESDFKAVKTAALSYYSDTGKWPGDEADEDGFVKDDSKEGWNGPYMEKWKSKNPWGGDYEFVEGVDATGFGLTASTKALKLEDVNSKAIEKLETDLDGGTSDADSGIVRSSSTTVYLVISEQ
ncbi:type II secretion system protein GspG [Clostridium sp. A1-XYC3]|uniref:Type II secretion system protein GspG n=1 Tax=Clostridium tanneri TaxID=3037988 RepID=A0ABU4JX49_9CLOT|nr:type II secretion system protein GspG [Clostridium sp. A1-XYC3]MDW8802734.1 type II secretion system protein GspG [Clostridium sp. A1-XYC3]